MDTIMLLNLPTNPIVRTASNAKIKQISPSVKFNPKKIFNLVGTPSKSDPTKLARRKFSTQLEKTMIKLIC